MLFWVLSVMYSDCFYSVTGYAVIDLIPFLKHEINSYGLCFFLVEILSNL